MTERLRQKTLKSPVEVSGIGLFTGKNSRLRLVPSKENTGIVFQRMDLPDRPCISASLEEVFQTPRCTILGKGERSVRTVEHLLSALSAYQIDNLKVEVFGPEVPVGDGSALAFSKAIEESGIQTLKEDRACYKLEKCMFWTEGEISLIAIPSEKYKITYALHFPNSSILRTQCYTFSVNSESFLKEIAPARTFALYEEIEPLLKKNELKGGGLENSVIIKEDKILNPEGVRYSDEMVRHKILDLMGDLALVGVKFHAHILAVRSGHTSNVLFAKSFLKSLVREST